jgi:hypothetical protein
VTRPGRTTKERSSIATARPYRLVSPCSSIMRTTVPGAGRCGIGPRDASRPARRLPPMDRCPRHRTRATVPS